jgi:parallel beta-helix repeat protein
MTPLYESVSKYPISALTLLNRYQGDRLMRGISGRLLSIAFVLIMAVIFISVGTSSTVSAADATTSITYTSHSAIIINGESQLVSTVASEGWIGDGTSTSPYIISGYDITASTYCIYIANTVSYVTISNCNLHGASSYAGIVLNNVQHVLATNNICSNNYYGIYMYGGSSNNTLSSNNVNGNNYMGIIVENSHYNLIVNNICTSGAYDSGIRITGSNYNIISGNTLTGHFHSILISYSNYNTVSNNNCNGGSYNCILLGTANYNIVSNNTCYSSSNSGEYSGNGIQLESGSTFNSVQYNICYSNIRNGIFVWGSSNNTLSHNTCYSNSYNGIYFLTSSSCIAINNTCYSNSNNGIRAYSSPYLTARDNICYSDSVGIFLSYTNYAMISNNTCTSDGDSGIRLEYSSYNTIDDNTCNNMASHGICLAYSSCDNNIVTNNTCSGNSNGIHLYSSDSNYVANNVLLANRDRGIYAVASSDHNRFVNNTCTTTNSLSSGIYVEYSTNETISNNLCYSTIYGVYLNAVTESTVSDNICNSSSYGIFSTTSSENEVINNTCYDEQMGIYMHSSSNNLISNNNCSGNTENGIFLYSSSINNTISENNCSDDDNIGISLSIYCDYNTITNNICIGNANTEYGIYIANSYNNIISGNICNGEVDCEFSIYLYYSDSNVISNNTCPNGEDGIWVYHSSSNVISGNVFCNNSIGVSIDTGFDNIVTNNTLVNNTFGVQIFSSNSDTVSNNLFYDSNVTGVNLLSSSYIDIVGNTFVNNSYGIMSESSNELIVAGNEFIDNRNGTFMAFCSSVDIYENRIVNCSDSDFSDGYGIHLYRSSYCDVWNNTCDDNMCDIFLNCTSNSSVNGNVCDGSIVGIAVGSDGGMFSENNAISNNTVSNSFFGIMVAGDTNSTVSGNVCSNHYFGIYVSESSGINVTDNDVTEADRGVCLYLSNYSVISSNVINACGIGVVIEISYGNVVYDNIVDQGDYGVMLDTCNDTVVNGNVIDRSSIYGIYITASEDNSIYANSINGSLSYGIYVNSSNGNLLFGNVLTSNNGTGVIYNSSAVQAYDDGDNDWNSTDYGNFWSDWTYPDVDLDGFVDANYILDGGAGNADERPIANASLSITAPVTMTIMCGSEVTVFGTAVNACPFTVSLSNDANGASGICTGTTSWSGTVALVEGYNNITVTMLDSIGRILTDDVTVIVDTTAPVLIVTSPENGSYNGTGIVPITWTVSDALVNVSSVMICVDDGAWMDVTNVTSFTNGTLSEGVHAIYFNATDSMGNYAITSIVIIVDMTKPTVIISAPEAGMAQNLNSVLVSWTASDDNVVVNYSISIDGTNWTFVNGTSYLLSGLEVGNCTIYVRAYDGAGNYNWTSVSFVIDDVDPSVTMTAPSDGSYDTDGNVTITWTGSDDRSGVDYYWVSVDGTIMSLPANATSYAFEGLSDGTHIISVRAFDKAGNNEWTVITVIVDTTAPIVTITAPGDGSYLNNRSVTLSWTAQDATSGVALTQISLDGTTWTTVSSSPYALSFSADGTYAVYVKVTDAVGLFVTIQVMFTVDTIAPSLEVIPADGDHVNEADLILSMNATDNYGISHYCVSMDGVTWAVLDGAIYLFEGLEDGNSTVYVRVYDLAGNYNESAVHFVVDTVAPTAISNSPTGDSVAIDGSLIEVRFSEEMDTDSFVVTVNGVRASWAWSSLNGLTFAPSSIEYGTEYTVIVTGADLAGNTVTFSWSFTTIEAGDIVGTLVNAYGRAMANVTVVLSNGMSVTTDDEGHFLFEDVPIGTYALSAVRDGYDVLSMNVTVTAGGEMELGDMEMDKTLNGGGDIFVIVAIVFIVAMVGAAIIMTVQQRRAK